MFILICKCMSSKIYTYVFIYRYVCIFIYVHISIPMSPNFRLGRSGIGGSVCDRKNCSEANDPWPFWHEPIGPQKKAKISGVGSFSG